VANHEDGSIKDLETQSLGDPERSFVVPPSIPNRRDTSTVQLLDDERCRSGCEPLAPMGLVSVDGDRTVHLREGVDVRDRHDTTVLNCTCNNACVQTLLQRGEAIRLEVLRGGGDQRRVIWGEDPNSCVVLALGSATLSQVD